MRRPATITKDCTVQRYTSLGDPHATLHLQRGTQVRILHPIAEQDGFIDCVACLTPNGFTVVVPNNLVEESML